MAGIYHPSRGGVRGGKDQFNWDDVKTDKDRENYLGHSVMVPVGKWQEGKDLVWYTREKNDNEAERKRKEEIKSMKDLEARAMSAALGHKSFVTGTTSLTAKELQEVLSRGQTSHNEGERIEGMGFKRSLGKDVKNPKYGTVFEGSGAGSVNAAESRSEKKKKKKDKKKKEKKKKRRHSSASDDDYVERKPPKVHKDERKPPKVHKDERHNERYKEVRRREERNQREMNSHSKNKDYQERYRDNSKRQRRHDSPD